MFHERAEEFAKVRALIMKIVTRQPGLTVEEISKQFLMDYGFLPRIDNRLREARELGWVMSKADVKTMRLKWFPNIDLAKA